MDTEIDGLGQVEKCFGDGLAYIIDQHNTNQKTVLTAPISFGYWSFWKQLHNAEM